MRSVLWNIVNCAKTYNSVDIREYLPKKYNFLTYAWYKIVGFFYHCSGYLEGYRIAKNITKKRLKK